MDDMNIFEVKLRDLSGGDGVLGACPADGGGRGRGVVVGRTGLNRGLARGHVISLLRESAQQYTQVMNLIDEHRFRYIAQHTSLNIHR